MPAQKVAIYPTILVLANVEADTPKKALEVVEQALLADGDEPDVLQNAMKKLLAMSGLECLGSGIFVEYDTEANVQSDREFPDGQEYRLCGNAQRWVRRGG